MLRRTAFKYLETQPELKEYIYGYGYCLRAHFQGGQANYKKIQTFLTEKGLFKKGQIYCNAYIGFEDCQTIDEYKKFVGLA